MSKRNQRHSPEKIVQEIQQAGRILAEGGDVSPELRELNVRKTMYHRWQNNYGGLNAEYSKKLKQLKKQNLQMNALAENTTLGPM